MRRVVGGQKKIGRVEACESLMANFFRKPINTVKYFISVKKANG